MGGLVSYLRLQTHGRILPSIAANFRKHLLVDVNGGASDSFMVPAVRVCDDMFCKLVATHFLALRRAFKKNSFVDCCRLFFALFLVFVADLFLARTCVKLDFSRACIVHRLGAAANATFS